MPSISFLLFLCVEWHWLRWRWCVHFPYSTVFRYTVADLFTVFDPELKVTIAEGKVFDAQDPRIQAIRQMPEVDVLTETLEENAMGTI